MQIKLDELDTSAGRSPRINNHTDAVRTEPSDLFHGNGNLCKDFFGHCTLQHCVKRLPGRSVEQETHSNETRSI